MFQTEFLIKVKLYLKLTICEFLNQLTNLPNIFDKILGAHAGRDNLIQNKNKIIVFRTRYFILGRVFSGLIFSSGNESVTTSMILATYADSREFFSKHWENEIDPETSSLNVAKHDCEDKSECTMGRND